MRFILVLRSTFELPQEPMRFVLVLRSTFEPPQEPMRFVLVLRSTFELPQEPMRFVLVLRSTFELPQEPMRFVLVLRSTFELPQEPMRFVLVLRRTFELLQEPMRLILVLRSTFELQQEPVRFILVLRSTFELKQEPVRFILVLRITFELPQEPMSSGSGSGTKFLYIQMELCEGDTLRAWIDKRNSPNERFPERKADAARISLQVLTAVEYIHSKGLIHRDLKPPNIMFGSDGGVKVGDFGLVTVAENDNDELLLERTKRTGTRNYMSPEQATQTSYDRKVDIYALGLIYFELIYNLATIHEKRKIWEDIRRRVFPLQFSRKFSFEHKLIQRMLSPSPEDRPDASELIRELDQYSTVLEPDKDIKTM
ncbi:Eukaryotic translation initiation factor 2-alpha kinase 3 [Anabarilius grahami]|uniref:non-specific serine/threonine protein kinase n=1 Tax=Anabarilius grahami TaxID=495550 RepID=A0A3N0XXR0_ANAGA|nr:Eukaryotic translation initiation factor 2-alpha kinase 3 [Anabarilius grahami]